MDHLVTFPLAFLGPIGWQEMIILAVLGVLIFGKRLPEVGKSIGKGIVEFKKGLAGIEDEADHAVSESRQPPRIESHTGGNTVSQQTPQDTAAPASTSTEPSSGSSHNASA